MPSQDVSRSHVTLLNLALLAGALAASVAAPCVKAQTPATSRPGPYVGAALGLGITNFKSEDFSPASVASSVGLPVGSLSGSDSPNTLGYKLSAGYRFNDWLGVELGAVDLGKAKYEYRAPSLGLDITSRYRTRALTLAGVASMPVTNDIALFGKLGLASTEVRNELTATAAGSSASDSAKKRKTNVYAGAGAEYRLNANMSLVGEYEYFGPVGDAANTGRARAQLVSLGVRYSF